MESSDYFWCAKCGVMSLDAWALDSCIPKRMTRTIPGTTLNVPNVGLLLG